MNVLDPDREREDEVYFTAAGIADPAERVGYLDKACAGNAALRRVVEEMLDSQPDADALITRATVGLAGTVEEIHASRPLKSAERPELDEVVGTRIDRYKIVQRLGDGGCGAVYMAEQELPVRRRVALKVIKLGMDTESVIARFETERQVLALMEHPNIAHVLDAGTTDAGRPYFVMELVSGTKITDYCDQTRASVNERLNLFIQVCQAVQHAHQKGIIHRDLKPSNILVALQDGKPVPKVIDFGVAKAIQTNLISHNVTTATGQLIGTPAYMSPEQAAMRGVDVDTRSDIYSLGVLLYELLTGQTPFDGGQLLSAGLDQMRKTLKETEPKRPSAMLLTLESAPLQKAAARRSTTAPNLVSEVNGDLDWLVMKALEKDPGRRYETASGLLIDIEHYLHQEPVGARPQTRVYRLQKLVRRNWLVFAAGTAVVGALVVGLGTSVWMFLRERELRHRAVAAEQEQVRLREIAERGLANEAELRRQSEAREAIVQATALIEQQAFAKADELIAKVPLMNPTFEGVEVFRTLGDWNAARRNWPAARDRFYRLWLASRVENASNTSLDITRAAVTYIECNDERGYEQFRQRVLETYEGTTEPLVAERVVKNCLLQPGGEPLLKALAPFAEVANQLLTGRDYVLPQSDGRVSWCCLSVALLQYRRGNWMESVTWSRRCLRLGEQPPPRAAAAQAILAMALFRSGEVAEAKTNLVKSRNTTETHLKSGLQPHAENAFWFDWIVAQILAREAETVVCP